MKDEYYSNFKAEIYASIAEEYRNIIMADQYEAKVNQNLKQYFKEFKRFQLLATKFKILDVKKHII
ncbi:MAG: hypothetical protein GX879_08905 [Bacteroidales bacterium]|nr:hypothetical protein [Bacteroidales bacterium]